ncbi:MAG TPA: hypothetical protein VFU05_05980, partial [Cyclobacteriaceae bacterium]|nr:hypothetical protein [Cyclobacteriaceae bacterium]
MMKLLLTFLPLWFAGFSVFAQNEKTKNAYTETVQVHINTDFLITGETLYYSIHCLDAQKGVYSTLSKLAYVELIGENERPFLQSKVSLTDGRGAGDFFLPSTLPSGNYTLISYTKWMRNFEVENFFQQQITIINPYLKSSSGTRPQTGQSIAATSSGKRIKNETKHVQITSDKKKYSPRQKVIVTIKNNDPVHHGKISLNVHKDDVGVLKTESSEHTAIQPSVNPSKRERVIFPPDLRGETIGGVVTEISSGRAIANAVIYLSIPGSSNIFQISKTDSTGRFYFNAKNIQAQDGLLFQADPSVMAPVNIILDHEFVDDYKSFKPQSLSIDTSMRARIEQRNVYGQIENAYFIKKRDSILTQAQKLLFDTPDKVYRLDDFTRFPTMEDIFREYMYEVAVSKHDGKFLLRLLNSTTKNGARFVNTPLLLMDGIPIFDTEILMSYNPLLIKTVSFITRPYVFGGILYDGILSANTYTGKAKELMVKPIRQEYTSWQ